MTDKKSIIIINIMTLCFELLILTALFFIKPLPVAIIAFVILAAISIHIVSYLLIKKPMKTNENEESLFHKTSEISDEESSESHLESIASEVFSQMDHGLIIIDDNSKITYMNKQAQDMIPSAIGADDVYYNVIRSLELKRLVKEAIGHKEIREELILLNKYYLFCKVVPVSQEGLTSYILINDLTKAKMLEQTKRDFFAFASHELKTPITVLKGYGELISNDMVEKDNLHVIAQQISKQSDLMNLFVEDMLTLSRLEVPDQKQYEAINLNEVLKVVLTQLQSFIDEKNLLVTVESQQIMYPSDYMDMYKMFKNIIENGIKYNFKNKVLTIKLFKENEHIIFTVRDEGMGIPRDELSRVFERFYRVDSVRDIQGTGLGLAIVKHIVSNYRGTIEIESSENEYTLVRITL